MTWLMKHKKEWRVAELALLVVAIMGPWTFDLINVPAQYPCSAPNIRLEGDFCGTPLSMMFIFSGMATGLLFIVGNLFAGTAALADLRFVLFGLLVVLPFPTTLLLILRGDRRPRQVVGVVAWGLAFSVSLLIGVLGRPNMFWVLWGVWLYAGVAVSALALEVLTLAVGKRLTPAA